jgi:hypothetical protein
LPPFNCFGCYSGSEVDMNRQYRLVETLIIAFVAGASASVEVAIKGVTADNWHALAAGLVIAALVAGGRAAFVAWTNYGAPTSVVPVAMLGAPYVRTWHLLPGQICPVSGQWTNSRTRKQATCVEGSRLPPDPKGTYWTLTDRTRHALGG